MSKPSRSYLIRVHFPRSEGGTSQTYRFDAVLEKEDNHTTWLYLAPRRVPEHRIGCVAISFDPSPTQRSMKHGEGAAAILQSLYFDGRCSAIDDPPLDPKTGTRAMLLVLPGAVLAFRHMARLWWPHIVELHLSDQSTYKCMPQFKNEILTHSTDLLTGDSTYYERHLGAHLESPAAIDRRVDIRRRMLSPIDASGSVFWTTMKSPDIMIDPQQQEWLDANGNTIVRLLDSVRERGQTWQDFFLEIRARYGCIMYACCSKQISSFFGMSRLMGAEYRVRLDAIKGSERATTTMEPVNRRQLGIDVTVSGGSGTTTQTSARMIRLIASVRHLLANPKRRW